MRACVLGVVAAFTLVGVHADQSASAAKPVKTTKGTFAVPGTAYLDGRDLEARPPLTVMKINVWDSAKRLSKVCVLSHGTSVSLLDVEHVKADERYYFKIMATGCVGWVPDVFLSPRRQPVVGSRE